MEENLVLDKCYEEAKKVVKKCSTKHGMFASAGKTGYNAVWSRDSMMTSIGASLSGKEFQEVFKQSIITLGENQSKNGQIPNCVDKFSERKPHVDYKSIDSSLWFLIGMQIYKKRYSDKSLIRKYEEEIKKSFNWLSCQDTGETGELTQLPTSDWQDAFPHKYGYTINTQALYYKALNLNHQKIKALKLKRVVNKNKDDSLWNGKFYSPYRWKNHGKYKEIGEFFDSLGNLLAIVFDLVDKKQTESIINHIKQTKINKPYPVKAIYPPIKKGDLEWHDYFLDCDAGKPYSYLNGGIWPNIGSFYVLALIKQKKFNEAEVELTKLAEANLKYNFPEWIHPIKKKGYGKEQAWDAGTYILAYESLKKKKVLI
jgi:glycogen debranching enzyme